MSGDIDHNSFFVIARQGIDDLVTSVLKAGRDGEEEALVAFTTADAARTYLQRAEWLQTETVAELQPADFLRWLIQSTENGPTLLAIDPDRVHQEDGMPQTVIPVEEVLNRLGPALHEQLATPHPA